MRLEMFFIILALGVMGFYFDSIPLLLISFFGIVAGFILMSKEAKVEKAPAVVTRPIVLNLPPEELESKHLTPDQMAMGFLPEPLSMSHMKFDPFASLPETAKKMLPFPNYGKTSPLEKMFFGVPFIGRHIWDNIIHRRG